MKYILLLILVATSLSAFSISENMGVKYIQEIEKLIQKMPDNAVYDLYHPIQESRWKVSGSDLKWGYLPLMRTPLEDLAAIGYWRTLTVADWRALSIEKEHRSENISYRITDRSGSLQQLELYEFEVREDELISLRHSLTFDGEVVINEIINLQTN